MKFIKVFELQVRHLLHGHFELSLHLAHAVFALSDIPGDYLHLVIDLVPQSVRGVPQFQKVLHLHKLSITRLLQILESHVQVLELVLMELLEALRLRRLLLVCFEQSVDQLALEVPMRRRQPRVKALHQILNLMLADPLHKELLGVIDLPQRILLDLVQLLLIYLQVLFDCISVFRNVRL